MYRESQHYLALVRFPALWGVLYMIRTLESLYTPSQEKAQSKSWQNAIENSRAGGRNEGFYFYRALQDF